MAMRIAAAAAAPAAAAAILLLTTCAFASPAPDPKCERNGFLPPNSTTCTCNPGWRGASCGELSLEPVVSFSSMKIWPPAAATGAVNGSGWGFTSIPTPTGYVAVVDAACGPNQVLASGGNGSFLLLLAGDTSEPAVNTSRFLAVLAGSTSFNPHMLVIPPSTRQSPSSPTPTSTVAVYFRVNAIIPDFPLCASDPRAPQPLPAPLIPSSAVAPGPPSGGTNIYLASAPLDKVATAAAWTTVRVNITGGGTVHKSNPSVTRLRDGRFLMAYRYNGPAGERNAVAIATRPEGPFAFVADIPAPSGGVDGNNEDPFVWQARDGSLHCLSHDGPHGYHAFASEAGTDWQTSPTGAHAYETTVETREDPQNPIQLRRRERPELLFDSAMNPASLITGVQAGDSVAEAFSMIQSIGHH